MFVGSEHHPIFCVSHNYSVVRTKLLMVMNFQLDRIPAGMHRDTVYPALLFVFQNFSAIFGKFKNANTFGCGLQRIIELIWLRHSAYGSSKLDNKIGKIP